MTGLLDKFESSLNAQKASGQHTGVVRALRAVHWKRFFFAGCCLFVSNVCACLPPLIINQILVYLTVTPTTCDRNATTTTTTQSTTACGNVMPDWAGYVLVAALFAAGLTYIFFQNLYFWYVVRVSCTGANTNTVSYVRLCLPSTNT